MQKCTFRKALMLLVISSIILSMAACANTNEENNNDSPTISTTMPQKQETKRFLATVLSVTENTLMVKPNEDTTEANSYNKIEVSLPKNEVSNITDGDVIEIVYNGEIAEIYPPQINTVKEIRIISHKEQEETMIEGTSFDTYHFHVGWTSEIDLLWDKASNKGEKDSQFACHIPTFHIKKHSEIQDFAKTYKEIIKTTEIAEQFNDAFFEKYDLLLVYVEATSGMDEFELKSIEKEGTSLCAHIKKKDTISVTCDMQGWIIGIAIEKEMTKDYSHYDADLNSVP